MTLTPLTDPHVLVGLGDGDEGRLALDWAAEEARARGSALRVVRAYHWSPGLAPWESAADRMIALSFRKAAEAQLRRAANHLAAEWPDVLVHTEAVDDLAWKVLSEQSAATPLTVLGAHHHGALGAALLGSVSTVVVARASGPVVVVGAVPGVPEDSPQVVVGLDGGENTSAVLGFALEHASRHGRGLQAVYCWRTPPWASGGQHLPGASRDRAERWLSELLAGWQEKFPDVTISRSVVHEHPVAGLVRASYSQALLVVGARSHHARTAALLGSVSQGVLHHATCPVAVLH